MLSPIAPLSPLFALLLSLRPSAPLRTLRFVLRRQQIKTQCGRAATQRGATAPESESLPLVARFLAERTTFSPLAVQRAQRRRGPQRKSWIGVGVVSCCVRCVSQVAWLVLCLGVLAGASQAVAQGGDLEQRLIAEGAESLAKAAASAGDAVRGAIVFHRFEMTCSRCHIVDASKSGLGPDLTKLEPPPEDTALVESVLEPSRVVREGYATVTVITVNGLQTSGLLARESDEEVVLYDLTQIGREIAFAADEIDEVVTSSVSPMPTGLTNQLGSRQEFLDLVRYLMEIRDGGAPRARELQPPPSLTALRLPDYEQRVDHAGFLRDLDAEAFQRGQKIYQRVCQNCHGTPEQPGSLPTSLRFATDRFKHGSDPYTMYQTLTRGFGLMAPQTWMVPQQKYDVIHFIRQAYLKPLNPSQYTDLDDSYLASLPAGDTRGPEPRIVEPWVTMDYGPYLINTYEIGSDGSNFAQKGIAVRLDPGPGGVSRGKAWMVFDHDTLRWAAAWTGAGFINWNGIHFNGQHQVHPRVVGDVHINNPTGPGWADPETGSFADEVRVLGRDGRRYGPLPRAWGHYRGLYHFEDQVVIAYDVGSTEILEMPGAMLSVHESPVVFTRTCNIGPRDTDLRMLVATHPTLPEERLPSSHSSSGQFVKFGSQADRSASTEKMGFDGASYLEVTDAADFDMTKRDFSITARIRTTRGGTILAKTRPESEWVPDAKAIFIRDGRLCYDIGWVGVVTSSEKVDDGQWHNVALRWRHELGRAELFIDGRAVGSANLRPQGSVTGHVVRVGFAASNFPESPSFFDGELQNVRFVQRAIAADEIKQPDTIDQDLLACWCAGELPTDERLDDDPVSRYPGIWHHGNPSTLDSPLIAGLSTPIPGSRWIQEETRLVLYIPAGEEPLRFVLWMVPATEEMTIDDVASALPFEDPTPDLTPLTQGGKPKWVEKLATEALLGSSDGPFAVDVLTHPETNPWLAQMRLTGIDFFSDPGRAAVCCWDGDVWIIDGLSQLGVENVDTSAPKPQLVWQRIASGLFQPLGIKIIEDQIYVTCRDQLVILRDRNGDGETDYYECFNNDHQVTEHFHEFAMGLQVDSQGNFYYAKSARHALPAVVPHHGTLLRIANDGSRTDILATGFRAANGVCLNPDGTFVVTDQEGHWNPKNRINWVIPGRFYGNMFGYHDVTDESDEAMEQPICWITNAFDRSPAELLWVPDDTWGPLAGSLLNLSYGYGKLYVVPWEEVDGQKQGGMCALPIDPLPTGVMRGRFHPVDRQLYTCGMFAWAGNATQPGGLYRIRYTDRPAYLPIELHARAGRLSITFTEPPDRASASDPDNYAIQTWSLKRTENYGSNHYDERKLKVTAVRVSDDGRSVELQVPELHPTWGMEVICSLRDPSGQPVQRVIHNSIFQLPE